MDDFTQHNWTVSLLRNPPVQGRIAIEDLVGTYQLTDMTVHNAIAYCRSLMLEGVTHITIGKNYNV